MLPNERYASLPLGETLKETSPVWESVDQKHSKIVKKIVQFGVRGKMKYSFLIFLKLEKSPFFVK